MTKDERNEYLDNWGHACYTCGKHTLRPEMHLVKSIEKLEKFPLHVTEEYIRYYMVCPECKEGKELI